MSDFHSLQKYLSGSSGSSIPIIFPLALFYAAGHAISSVSKILIVFSNFIRRLKWFDRKDVSENGVTKAIKNNSAFKKVIESFGFSDTDIDSVRIARSRIISMLSPDDANIVRKFTFIALFNIGLATALSIILMISSFIHILQNSNILISWKPLSLPIMLVLFVLILAFIDRYNEFFERSMRIAFSMYNPGRPNSPTQGNGQV